MNKRIELKDEDIEVRVEKGVKSSIPINKSQILIRLHTKQAPKLKSQILYDYNIVNSSLESMEKQINRYKLTGNNQEKDIMAIRNFGIDFAELCNTFYKTYKKDVAILGWKEFGEEMRALLRSISKERENSKIVDVLREMVRHESIHDDSMAQCQTCRVVYGLPDKVIDLIMGKKDET